MAHAIKGFLFGLKEKVCLGQNFGVSNSENSNKCYPLIFSMKSPKPCFT